MNKKLRNNKKDFINSLPLEEKTSSSRVMSPVLITSKNSTFNEREKNKNHN